MKYDITINKNAIDGRQGYAYVCNAARFPVLIADLDEYQEYDDYHTFGGARVEWDYNGKKCYSEGYLEYYPLKDKWSIGHSCSCISSQFTYWDKMDSINNACLPIVRKNDIIAIAACSAKEHKTTLYLLKVTHVDVLSSRIAALEPLSDEEMRQVAKDAKKWCDD